MRNSFHVRIKGSWDFKTFQDFLSTHEIEYAYRVKTVSSTDEDIYDYLVDLSSIELIQVYLMCNVIHCCVVPEPPGVSIEVISDNNI